MTPRFDPFAVVLLALIAPPVISQAAPLPAAARAEVLTVLERLAASGCQFERNGSWYSGAEARAHLLKKLDAVESRASLASAEEFIDKAASASSMSGQAYKVRCGTAAVVDSGPWLRAQLQALRAPAGRGASAVAKEKP